MHVAQVVEHAVGGMVLPNPGVELQRTVAVLDGAREVANGAGRNAQRHVGVGDSKKAFGIHGCVQCTLKVLVGAFELPE